MLAKGGRSGPTAANGTSRGAELSCSLKEAWINGRNNLMVSAHRNRQIFLRCGGEMDKAKALSSRAATQSMLANSAGLVDRGALPVRNDAFRRT